MNLEDVAYNFVEVTAPKFIYTDSFIGHDSRYFDYRFKHIISFQHKFIDSLFKHHACDMHLNLIEILPSSRIRRIYYGICKKHCIVAYYGCSKDYIIDYLIKNEILKQIFVSPELL